MLPKVDLRQLAVARDAPAVPAAPRRRLLTRVVLPGLLLVGFAGLVAYALRETLSPPRAVTVIPVLTAQARGDQPADAPLFRGAGWVEPRPTARLATALSEGVVEQLLVVEGQEVKRGQLVARLVSADAKLALESAEADVQLREAELVAADAALSAATARVQDPVHLKVELADAEAALAKAESEQAGLASQLKAAQSRQAAAQRDWDYRQKATDVVPAASLAKSKSDLEAATAAVEELQTRQKRLPVEVAALKGKRDALQLKAERKVDEVRQAAEARSGVATARARLRQAKVACDAAKLKLERMEIKAPASGRVLALVARPGMRLTGLNPGSLHDSSTVLTLYDPANLQARVDVRLDDVAKVFPGQKARIESAAAPGKTFEGRVLLATSQADIQKNTLSVKVALIDPPAALRPEMLCQVTFLSPPRTEAPGERKHEPYRMLVPKQLIESSAAGPALWVADRLSGTARRRVVELGLAAGDLVEVVSGLDASDKVIVGGREGLRDGDRVRVAGEDETLGIAAGKGS